MLAPNLLPVLKVKLERLGTRANSVDFGSVGRCHHDMLVLMCGTSFSGKSTFARALAAEIQAMVISLDEINERRGLWGGDGMPLEEWQRTHEIATAEARAQLLGASDRRTEDSAATTRNAASRDSAEATSTGRSAVPGRSVIVDDTSSPRFLRDGWRSLARQIGVGFLLVYLDVDQATIRRRQADNRVSQGRRDVTDAVLEEHLAGFEPPEPDEAAVRVTSVNDLIQVLKYLAI